MTTNPTNVVSSDEAPISACALRIVVFRMNGLMMAVVMVKMTTAMMNAAPFRVMSSRTTAATINPIALAVMETRVVMRKRIMSEWPPGSGGPGEGARRRCAEV